MFIEGLLLFPISEINEVEVVNKYVIKDSKGEQLYSGYEGKHKYYIQPLKNNHPVINLAMSSNLTVFITQCENSSFVKILAFAPISLIGLLMAANKCNFRSAITSAYITFEQIRGFA